MVVENWVDVLISSLQNVWLLVVGFVPSLIGALIIFVIGLLVAAGLERLVERIIFYLKLDGLLRKIGVEVYLQRANLQLNAGHFLGKIVYWFVLVVFFLAASDILGFIALSDFLRDVLNYIPNIAVAVLIMIAALIVANFLRGLVRVSAAGARLHSAAFLGSVVWWVVLIFGALTACAQLGIAVNIINTVITGVIAMFALAGGLAFGLGGKDAAANLLAKAKEEIKHPS